MTTPTPDTVTTEQPDVTIVLISYNDAARLPHALASCREQTLSSIEILVVDDASTDDTSRIVAEAQAADPRVRGIRLPENSGGCSRPRNTGIEHARGRWVMFCDSDDRLERHAAKNLLLVAERAGAQVACGVVERVDVKTGKVKRWKANLHQPAILEGLAQRPELIADTVSVNKIYDRQWLRDQGITFPEGILYEDQFFTFAALALASRIAVIDKTVYHWSVERLSDDLSITQRRDEQRNVRSRIAVNELIDDFIVRHDLEWVRPVKDHKFLSHDLYLYLSTILDADDETAEALIDELVPYVSKLDGASAARLRPALRVAVAHLLLRDLDHLRTAMRTVRWSAVIGAPVRTSDGRDIWSCGHEHGPALLGQSMHWWLDVTNYHVSTAPIAQLRLCHLVTNQTDELGFAGTTVTVRDEGVPDSAELVLLSGERIVFAAPLAIEPTDSGWVWTTAGPFAAAVRDARTTATAGRMAIRAHLADAVNVQTVRMRAADVATRRGTIVGLPVTVSAGEHGEIGWRAAKRKRRLVRRVAATVANRIAILLPGRGRGVVFCAVGGKGRSDVIAALSSGLAAEHPRVRQGWIVAANPEAVPTGVHLFERSSVRAQWRIGRARVVVEDGGIPGSVRVRGRAMCLHASQSVPVARIGRDDPDFDLLAAGTRRTRLAPARRWTHLLLSSEHDAVHRGDALGFTGTLVIAGSVRGTAARATEPADARASLGLRPEWPVLLWAPEIAADNADATQTRFEQLLEALVEAVGDRAFILVHSRALKLRVPAVLRTSARDMSAHADIATLIAASDVVLTDVSPLMFEAARAGRPVVIDTRVLARFISRTRGVTFDLLGNPPGEPAPSVRAIVDAVTAALDDPEQAMRAHERAIEQAAGLAGPAADVDVIVDRIAVAAGVRLR